MAINITNTDIDCNFVKVLVYGDSGVGKTTLIKTAPRPIIISTESGLMPLRGLHIPVIKCSTYDELSAAYEYVTDAANHDAFDTICLDSISDLAETCLAANKREFKDPRQSYGKLADEIADVIRAFRDIETHHVYFTAKMARNDDTITGIARCGAMMPGKQLPQQLPYFFDEVLALQVGTDEDGDSYRYLQTQPSITHTAKDRSGKLSDPELPDLAHIFNKIVGGKIVKPTKT